MSGGADPDTMTQSEFDDYASIAPLALKYERGDDVTGELAQRSLKWELSLGVVFGDLGNSQGGNPDELGG